MGEKFFGLSVCKPKKLIRQNPVKGFQGAYDFERSTVIFCQVTGKIGFPKVRKKAFFLSAINLHINWTRTPANRYNRLAGDGRIK